MKRIVLVAALALSCGACDRLADFELESNEAFCGRITTARRYREGLSPRVQMRLKLDVAQIETEEVAGTITTFDAEAGESARLLDAAALRPIPAMAHDALSGLEFGDGRERNLMYAVSPSDRNAESLLAVISLRHDERVEVRLVRPGKLFAASGEPAEPAHRPLFGLFMLARQVGDCGF
jgi:hypothetical protein